MSVRFSPAHWPFAALVILAALTLALLAPRPLPAGEDKPCNQSCPACPYSQASQPCCADRTVRLTYAVGDLVTCPGVAAEVVCVSTSTQAKKATAPECRLISLITETVAPESWSGKGGKGTIDYTPMTMTLTVSQTPAVQKQVSDLLTALRKEQDVQVALEVRFVCVDEEGFARLGLDPKESKALKTAGTGDKNLRVNFLQDAQVVRLLKGTQGNCCCNVMQAPKVTVFNGQCSNLEVVDKKQFVTGVHVTTSDDDKVVFAPVIEEIPVGLRLNACPLVSADRRFVNVTLNADLSDCDDGSVEFCPLGLWTTSKEMKEAKPPAMTQLLQRPHISRLTMDGCVAIPDGVTAVVSGLKRDRVERTEVGVPVLSDIPYLNRLFTNVGVRRGKECVLMMVTPRIVVAEEEEEKKTEGVKRACCESDAKCCDEPTTCPACPACQAAKLVEKYHQACAEGRRAEAVELAVKALAVDSACFHNGGKCPEPVKAPRP